MNEDAAIVHNVLGQRPGAFDRLMQRHKDLVWHIAHRVTQNSEASADVFQEVFLQVHLKLHQFKGQSSLATWIGRIAHNMALRHLKKNEKYQTQTQDIEVAASSAEAAATSEHNALRMETHSAVHRAIEQLNPTERVIIDLYHIQELPVADIAEICQMPEGTVKSHLHRARLNLKNTLKSKPLEVS